MIASRMLAFAALVGIVGVGCLFPSFDDLEAPPGGTDTKKKDGSSTPGSPDAGEGGAAAATVSCGGTTTCKLPDRACCVGIGALTCLDADNRRVCDSQFGLFVTCDGRNDCPSGQVCCRALKASIVACAATCNAPGDAEFCNGDQDACGAGRTCTADLGNGYLGCAP